MTEELKYEIFAHIMRSQTKMHPTYGQIKLSSVEAIRQKKRMQITNTQITQVKQNGKYTN